MDHAFCAPGAPKGLTDRGKSRSCERAETRRGKILDVSERGATKARDANPRFPDGSQTVRCSRIRYFRWRRAAISATARNRPRNIADPGSPPEATLQPPPPVLA